MRIHTGSTSLGEDSMDSVIVLCLVMKERGGTKRSKQQTHEQKQREELKKCERG